MEYIYTYICKSCGRYFQESRSKPYKNVHTTKLCSGCKGGPSGVYADVLGGFGCDSRCGNCSSFSHYVKQPHHEGWSEEGHGWGFCEKGRTSDGLGELVYEDDNCPEFERGSDAD